jgi:hypothetical protein
MMKICTKCSTELKKYDRSYHEAFDCPPKPISEKRKDIKVLQNGLVLLKHFLDYEQQQYLEDLYFNNLLRYVIDYCIRLGEGKANVGQGFFDGRLTIF